MLIAIIGASGFIGNRIFQSLCSKQTFNLIGTYYKHKEQQELIYLDVTSREFVEKFLVEHKPDLIFWLAGSKNLKKCEDDWEYAYQINTQPIKDYYEIKRRLNLETRLFFFSTDYVFDGLHGNYKDTDVRLSRFEFTESLIRINKKYTATILPDSALNNGALFQHDLSLIQSSISKKFQTKDFENYILEELSK